MGACCSTSAVNKEEEVSRRTALLQASQRKSRLRNNLVHQSATEHPLNKYEIVKQLGVGSMGSVASVRRQHAGGKGSSSSSSSTSLYAMKTLRLGRISRDMVRELRNEIKIVSDLDHPSIVKFYEVYYAQKQIYIVMELCSGGDLYKREPYTERQAADIIQQVLSAVDYMHGCGYVHRDLKFENIMFESSCSSHVKIIDFGLSCRYDPSRPLKAQLGTFNTMAPEVISGNYTSQCDLWSIGVITFELLSGRKPFESSTVMGLITKISQADYKMDDNKAWKNKSKAAKRFCRALLQANPKKRLTASEARNHKWLSIATGVHNSIESQVANGDNNDPLPAQFVSYGRTPEIQKIGMLLVAHQSFPAEVAKLRDSFEQYDVDGSGYISIRDFETSLKSKSTAFSVEEMKQIFNGMDAYHDGKISYTEFLAAALTAHSYITEERVAELFDDLDVDQSGYITIEDLQTIMGNDFSTERAQKVIAEADTEKDGKISYEEFLRVFRHNVDELAEVTLSERSERAAMEASPR